MYLKNKSEKKLYKCTNKEYFKSTSIKLLKTSMKSTFINKKVLNINQ